MDRTLKQFLNFIERHLDELFREGEDLPHADADELVALSMLRFEITQTLLSFSRRTKLLQPSNEVLGRELVAAHSCSVPSCIVRSNRSRFSRSEEHTSELQSRGHLVCR